ncbi:Cytochrome P450 family oxidoreductase [Ceratobasidium theobromae]|uniref:Cytochrome P450 family oxidoreductase n=1 Tax=Ceratobasidium theobromae TaxID=1582974 RepID=A0A5N5QDN5_9AGAM|nr:Cytochrome P450 family oxidoreductase [Ceratobasidium theobromae]
MVEDSFSVSNNTSLWAISLLLVSTLGLIRTYLRRSSGKASLPPSPPKHWFWGNKDILNQPYKYVSLGVEYKQKLGDIISLSTPLDTTIIVNTMELATELLEKHAAITANRPRNIMVQDILGWSRGIGIRQHDEGHKKLRRVIASALHATAARTYASQHVDSTLDLLRRISNAPAAFRQHTNDVVGEFIIRLAYGQKAVESDHLVETIHQAFSYFILGTSTYFAVNDFPICEPFKRLEDTVVINTGPLVRYLPAWVPGAGFQIFGKEGRELRERYATEPFEMVFEQVRKGQVEFPSYTSQLLEAKGGANISDDDIQLVKWSAGSMFTAYTIAQGDLRRSKTVGLILSFVLMAAIHPEVAKNARAEIDEVVGRGRIPELHDRSDLPYVEAFFQEVLRMYPVAPIGLPHVATEDIEFQGYRIPKGSTINANIWAMLRDPKHFSDPNVFDPTRFLKPMPDPDPRKYIFGFGRRICPGLHVANNSAWVMCAGILAVYDIYPSSELQRKVDSLGGRRSEQLYKLSQPYLVSDPLPFLCDFIPRDQAAIALLDNSAI